MQFVLNNSTYIDRFSIDSNINMLFISTHYVLEPKYRSKSETFLVHKYEKYSIFLQKMDIIKQKHQFQYKQTKLLRVRKVTLTGGCSIEQADRTQQQQQQKVNQIEIMKILEP